MRITLRREEPSDHRTVEMLTREAFWGMDGAGCDEHLLVHRLRGTDAFVPELDVVAVVDGAVVGNVMYSRARVVGDVSHDVLTFGPLTVLPEHQGSGVGGALMRHTLAEAARLGHRAVVVYGHPDYYPRFGFVRAGVVGITAPGGATFDALMALALVEGGLDGVRGEFHEDPVFRLDREDVAAFDRSFPAKEPAPHVPVADLGGAIGAQVVSALRAHGVEDVSSLRRSSAAEVAAWDGVGPQGCATIRAAIGARGIPWGDPAVGSGVGAGVSGGRGTDPSPGPP